MLEIPYNSLSSEALLGLLEEYATRGGFESDDSLESRVQELQSKLRQGKIWIMYDPDTDLTNLTDQRE